MVASYETGTPVRSLVRVPGSGNDSTLPSECLDLSKVSSLAATVFVPRTLPLGLIGPRQTRNDSTTNNPMENSKLEKTLPAPPIDKTVKKRKYAELQESKEGHIGAPALSTNPTPSKKPRVVYLTPEQVLHAVRNKGAIIALPLQHVQQQLLPQQPPNLASSSQRVSVSQLQQELNTIRGENKALQRQLLLFQQLFKNKERLASVVQRLESRVA